MENFKTYTFSIIIPCLNEEDYIKNCLDSIIAQEYELNKIEIIIVDGNSTDNTLNIIHEYQENYSQIKLFRNPLKKTPISLNIGIKNSVNQIIVILGAHTKLDKEFIRYNNKFLHEKNAAATGGTQINVGNNFIQCLIGTVMEIPFAMATARYRWSKKEQYVDTVVYAAYKREIFEEIGLFEEKIIISEDAEINWRIRQAGNKIFFSPLIKSYYYPRNTILKFLKQMFRYGILRVNMFKKHPDSVSISHLIPPIFAISLILLLILGFFFKKLFWLLIFFIMIHLIIGLILSINNLLYKKIKYIFFTPLIIFLLHLFWGMGFIFGLISIKFKKSNL